MLGQFTIPIAKPNMFFQRHKKAAGRTRGFFIASET